MDPTGAPPVTYGLTCPNLHWEYSSVGAYELLWSAYKLSGQCSFSTFSVPSFIPRKWKYYRKRKSICLVFNIGCTFVDTQEKVVITPPPPCHASLTTMDFISFSDTNVALLLSPPLYIGICYKNHTCHFLYYYKLYHWHQCYHYSCCCCCEHHGQYSDRHTPPSLPSP